LQVKQGRDISNVPSFDLYKAEKSPLRARDDPWERDFNQYCRDNPNNIPPDFATAANDQTGALGMVYERYDIWESLNRGYYFLQRMNENPDPRPSYGGTVYPHYFGAAGLQYVNIGDAQWGNLYEYPLVPYGNWNGGPPGLDRVVFDRQGRYVGLITHRGSQGNNFHWAPPTDMDANPRSYLGTPGWGRAASYVTPSHGQFMRSF
jgi:hypothetical protein